MDNEEIERCRKDPDYIIQKYYRNNKFCMAYNKHECSGDICKAHTISKKYLKNLARNGHVYMPISSAHHKKNLYEFELTGISKSTRITGFCKQHDSVLFQSFEKNDFIGDYTQIYDLTFRTLCSEYFKKQCLLSFFDSIEHGKLKDIDQTGFSISSYFKEKQSHVINEIRDHKFLYEQFKKYEYCGLSYLLIEVNKLPIATTGIFFPLHDPAGNKIQNENKKQLGFVYNTIPLNNRSYIIISSVKTLHNNLHREFLLCVKNMGGDFINYFLTLAFFNNDNIVLNPDWFEGLKTQFKDDLDKRMNYQVGYYGSRGMATNLDFLSTMEKLQMKIQSSLQ